jgi:shikimate kinase
MQLSRNEEVIFRELQALAGDLNQIAANITRDHEERLREAEENEARRREQADKKMVGGGFAMRGFDRQGLNRDLVFIAARLNLLLEYTEPEKE